MGLLTKLFEFFTFIMEQKIIDYNKRSIKKYGWDLSWFGASNHEDALVSIREFQERNDLEPDGMVGPMTFRRIFTERESEEVVAEKKYIVCNGESVEIDWEKVVNLEDENALVLSQKCYRQSSSERKPAMIVTHWDAALSAKSCHKILEKRGLSSHFVIDNDGTIFQMVDTNNTAWHAKGVNDVSIGIDFSNAYYTKYQKWYMRKGFGRRPLLENSYTNGYKHKPHLGYYPAQLEAYKELLKTLCGHYSIPVECPRDAKGKYLTKEYDPAIKKTYKGIVCHFNLTKKKIDCAGLELDKIVDEITESDN